MTGHHPDPSPCAHANTLAQDVTAARLPWPLSANTDTARGDSAGAAGFQSILFPPGLDELRAERTEQPDCFVDLNLDQIIAAVVAKRDEAVLRPLLYSAYRNEQIVRHRQAVFADLTRPETFRMFPPFCETMRSVQVNLADAARISHTCYKHMVHLHAAGLYCEGVTALLRDLQSATLRSAGLRQLRAYLADYLGSATFRQLAKETSDLREALSRLSYGMLFRGDKVMVRRYAHEPDYTVTILERFAKFREVDAAPAPPPQPQGDIALNHIEDSILEFVGRLFPESFQRLGNYVGRHADFIDDVIARLDREIGFFIAYLDFIEPLKRAGLPFCAPDVSVSSKETSATNSFDLALAAKLVQENKTVVCNSFHLTGRERLLVISGPNQGGKTTFARMFGQLHFLAGLGCPVPGESVRLFLADRIFTHFEREENITNLRGKLEDELTRLHRSCEAMTPDSVLILNEIFNSTSLEDQIFLSTGVLERILEADAIGVCVTFLDTLSKLSEKTVSMVSTVAPDDPAQRTFEIIRRPADGLAYALSLARKHGVTYEQLCTRIGP